MLLSLYSLWEKATPPPPPVPFQFTSVTTCTVFQIGHAWIWSETGMKAQNPEHIFREARKLGIQSIEFL